MEKRGINEVEQEKVQEKIEELESRYTDKNGLTKSAGGDISVDVIGWGSDYITFGVKSEGRVIYSMGFPRQDFGGSD